MDWETYQRTLMPLVQHFGKVFYTIEKIRLGFQAWKGRDQKELETIVKQAIATNTLFDIQTAKITQYAEPKELSLDYSKHPSRRYYKHEEPQGISDNFLNNYLKENGVSSLIELMHKNKAQNN